MRKSASRFLPVLRTSGITYLGFACSLASAPVLARDLGAGGRGEFAQVLIVVTILGWAGFVGLPRGLAVGRSSKELTGLEATAALFLLGILNALIAGVLAPAALGASAEATTWLRINGALFIVSGFSQLGVEVSALSGRLTVWNLIRFIGLVLPSLAIFYLHLTGELTLTSSLAVTCAANAITTSIGVAYLLSTRVISLQRANLPWKFSLNYWAGTALDGVGGRGDQLVLASLTSVETLGLYAVATTCASITGGVGQALNVLAYNRRRTGSTYARTHVRRLAFCSFVSGAIVIIVVWALGVELFGAEYGDLYTVVAILVVTQGLSDQWQWRVYAASLAQQARHLPLASASFIAILFGGTFILATLDLVSAVSVALLTVAANAGRLLSHNLLRRRAVAFIGS